MPQFVDLRLIEEAQGRSHGRRFTPSEQLRPHRSQELLRTLEDELHLKTEGRLDKEWALAQPRTVTANLPTLAEVQQELKTANIPPYVHSSCAGACSAEFGKYLRKRDGERKRLEGMYNHSVEVKKATEFEQNREKQKAEEEAKTARRSAKRKKKEAAAKRRKEAARGGTDGAGQPDGPAEGSDAEEDGGSGAE
eukprot:TRINITY_DN8960_c0_g1_i1.p2 TRINITY_DN8960_c0_g1~~TRINITY_DN8960_c0_g1_i1.p2  ORF type:complete len:204 (-),score=71.03 TRINITY_DN8960_c0_g1_i1:104-685(-)